MPDYLRALVAILIVTLAVFSLAKNPACAAAIPGEDFERRRNVWLALTVTVFLAHDFWIFVAVATVLLLVAAYRDSNRMALFLFLVFAVPALSSEISGFGLARQLFDLSYPRLLALTILLPTAFVLFANPAPRSPTCKWPDRLLAAYIGLTLVLQLGSDTFTNTLRYGLYHCMDVVLPYYVASRSLRSLREFRHVLMSFAVAAMILAAIGTVEFFKAWLLYSQLDTLLGLDWGYGSYLLRGESLRAQATTGQPIALGFVMAVACGFFLFLKSAVTSPAHRFLGAALLLAGLVVPLSRGPWLGAAVGFTTFVATGPKPFENLTKLGLAGLVAAPLVLASPLGEAILGHLPFVGTIESETIAYRQQLLEMSMDVIRQYPFFGSFDFLRYLEDLRQGQGIIDVVNTYLGVALTSGLVGLALFVSFFGLIAVRLYRILWGRPDLDEETRLLGRALFATLVAILAIIFTVSSITVIPIVYWSVAGLGLAYVRLLEEQRASRPAPVPLPRIAPQET